MYSIILMFASADRCISERGYISSFFISHSDYLWDISTWTNQKWAHPFCCYVFTRLCLSSLFVSLALLKQYPSTTSGGYLSSESFFCRYGWGWISLCICGGQPCHPASTAAQAEPGSTAYRGGTDLAVLAGEHGIVWHGHRSLLHLPSLPTWICEYQISESPPANNIFCKFIL